MFEPRERRGLSRGAQTQLLRQAGQFVRRTAISAPTKFEHNVGIESSLGRDDWPNAGG